MNNSTFQAKITAIGNEMVNCPKCCEGISLDASSGILPRCLFFEAPDSQQRGCAVIGLNPGQSKEKERSFYLQEGQTYQQTITFWEQRKSNIRYYKRLKDFVKKLGLEGPILWTELVKCENMPPSKKPLIKTISICTHTYLSKELEHLPKEWPLIGIGKDSFNLLSFLYPERAILGVPHPTGSRGQFSKILSLPLNNVLDKLWDGETGKALWLGKNVPPSLL
jgi:hypothetical protein